ncbi:glycosyltransferase family 39 protein [Aeromicrobium sp. Leaf350]|uniref:ArnT family glycosyltransferase n=1 Tax=Aeromicrobium sp. Leaf350 TaxID=2876565 RepID=UPI001E411BC3|nr:glycosyltransferase family 39 protein [Aeromicrobium sp. Leaf350]
MQQERRASLLTVLGLAALTVALRLPFLGAPAGNDEAGYLIVGDSWGSGSSLYGDYWVDRPPLLLWIFDAAGDLTTIRLLGCLAAAVTVLAVGATAAVAAGRHAAPWAAGTAAVLCASPWLGTVRVNGEMLAAPFVALALLCTVLALHRPRDAWWAATAGVLATCGLAVKQSTVDGFVFAVVAISVLALTQPSDRHRSLRVLAGGVGGAVATTALLVLGAALRGTDPGELFEALIVFRVDAGRVIGDAASEATTERFLVLVGTWAVSGLAMVSIAVLVLAVRRRREPVIVATAATILAVSAVAVLGGSYWAHYLQQLVPAVALGAGLVAAAVAPWLRRAGAVLVVAGLVVTMTYSVAAGSQANTDAQDLGQAVRDVSEPGDTMVVAYGQPNVLLAAEMQSPYENLWSLPIRVRDPQLTELVDVLRGPDAPTWVVEWSDFDTWAVDAEELKIAVADRYRPVATPCGHVVWLRQDLDRGTVEERDCG